MIQWIYEHYGHRHAAITAVVSRYRTRGAVREVGKALGLSEDVTSTLSGQVWGWSNDGVAERHVEELGLDKDDPRLALTLELTRQLIGTPRHLSQHPGGFVLTHDRLDDLVPIEPAAMEDRWVIEWEKDDLEELKIMKLDVLGLGMLGCMRRAFDLLDAHKGQRLDLASPEMQDGRSESLRHDLRGRHDRHLPDRKPGADVDAAASQAAGLLRHRHPGRDRPARADPGQYGPSLSAAARRQGETGISQPELEEVLKSTFGVPLFQEQAMKVAIVGAGFSPSDADALRRAMATFKSTGGVTHFRDKMINGMIAKGYEPDFAERTFKQIEGFGSYGFPESHAASFAKIAYASSWMKCYHPEIFCAALLNAQPMGFYALAQLVRDAREHGVEIRPVCVNASRWDCTLEERGQGDYLPLRLGFRQVKGLSNEHGALIAAAAMDAPFASIDDVWTRSGVPASALEKLADADAFQALGLDRRQALWKMRGLGTGKPLPLFAVAEARGQEPEVALTPLTAGREVVEDYRAVQLSLRDHPLAFLREELQHRGVVPCGALKDMKDGAKVRVAGIVLIRQKPGNGKVTFITLEDETGIANAIAWQRIFDAHRRIILAAAMIAVHGRLQSEGKVTHIVSERIEDLTPLLATVGDRDFPHRTGPGDGARNGGYDPRDGPRSKPAELPGRDGGMRIRSRNFH